MTLGEFIKARRGDLGLTVQELAARCDVTTQAIYNWEGGQPPGSRRLESLGRALDLDDAGVAEMVRLIAPVPTEAA